MNKTKILAIIPARGGSKRILRKNIKNFLGKPIIAYSIEAALESKIFDEVMVSTDDIEISKIAINCGASVPFFRTMKNSDDYATTSDVISEVLQEYKKLGKEFDYICCLYATAPFVSPKKLIKAKKLLEKTEADSVFPVTVFTPPIQRSFKIGNSGIIKMNWPEYINSRSQELKPNYHDAGQFYFFRCKSFLKYKILFMKKAVPLIVGDLEAQDIDNEDDWKIAEFKIKLLTKTHDK